MAKTLKFDSKLGQLTAREDAIKRQLKMLQVQIKEENFRLRAAVSQLAGAAYFAAVNAGSLAPTKAEILAQAREIVGPKDQDALAEFERRLVSADATTQAPEQSEPVCHEDGAQSDEVPAPGPDDPPAPLPDSRELVHKTVPLPRPKPLPPVPGQGHAQLNRRNDEPGSRANVSVSKDDPVPS